MFSRLKKKWLAPQPGEHEMDKSLFASLVVLIVFGLVMLFSASSVVSYAKYGNTYHYLLSQLVSLAAGGLFFFVAWRVDYHAWKKLSGFLLFFSIFLLIAVFLPGLRANYGTARSWIVIFGNSLQTSELVKICFLIYLASWLEAKKEEVKSFTGTTLPFFVILGFLSLLMALQPNLGTLFIIGAMSLAVFYVGGGRFSHLLFIILMAGLALLLLLTFKHSYQTDRFLCLKNLNYSIQDKCYQVNQSLIAIGSGGLFGRGLGKSREKFLYLPEVWADSIFPIIAEETGFLVSSLLILLYLFIFYRGLVIARTAPDSYGSMLAVGVVTWLAVQTFMNIGGMTNLVPMTGVPLPFISAGGTAILAALGGMGLLLNISKQTKGSYH